MKRKRILIWLAAIVFLVVCINLNPTKLDFIKHIRNKDLNIKFPMVKNETQDYTTIIDFRIFTIYKFTKTEHSDIIIAQDTNQVYMNDYNGTFNKTSNIYLGILKTFIKLKSKMAPVNQIKLKY